MTSAFTSSAQPPQTLQQLHSEMASLENQLQKLRDVLQVQKQRIRSARRWNVFSIALAGSVTAVAWMTEGSAWMRTSLLPLVLVMVLLYEIAQYVIDKATRQKFNALEKEVRELQSLFEQNMAATASH